MKRFNKTATLKDLLEESVFNSSISKNKMNNVIKHSTIFSFWNSVVGLKFSNHTKPYAIKANKLYVSTKSPVVAQELSLYKLKLLNKINSYSKPLGIEINDIIFNYKNYNSSVPETLNQKEDIPVELKEKEIDNVNLDARRTIPARSRRSRVTPLRSDTRRANGWRFPNRLASMATASRRA